MAVIAVLSFALILLLRQPRKMPGAQAAAFVDVGHA
jgi:hypothetical protein